MKKVYISPSLEVININGATQLMVGSTISINTGTDAPTVNTSDNGGSAQLGRDNNGSSSVWDREW